MTEDDFADLIDSYKSYFSDLLFDGLTSIPRSKDVGLEYYRQMIKNKTEEEIREFTDKVSEQIVNKHLELTNGLLTDLTNEQQDKILKQSLREVAEEFQKKWDEA